MNAYESLVERVKEINDIGKAAQLMAWDRETNMPKAASMDRNHQLTTLSKLLHKMSTSAEMGEMIEAAQAEKKDADPDGMEARLLAALGRDYGRATKLDKDLVMRIAQMSGPARNAWVEARENNDFAHFQPHLETVVELCQEIADSYGYEDEKYDALLDGYEQGMKTKDVRDVFNKVKAETVPLLQAITERGRKIDDAILHQNYPVETQIAAAKELSVTVGYDIDRGHLGTVVHPFATSFSRNDARITSRWYPDFINPGLFGTLHESGHAMYEQGTHEDFARTPLARGTSLGFHESQSRSIENVIGRSLGYWEQNFSILQKHFPEQFGGRSVEEFYLAINKVQPSFIRVEADELTYNFHIILRFELEQAMLNGDLAVADLPTAWNDKMNELLGVVPPTDTLGCLQDVHWSRPGFGYFPTYALGNFYGAQMFETATSAEPALKSALENGDPIPYVNWLRENVHQHGRKYPPSELIVRATGKPLSPEPFIRYATEKFTKIYDL